MATQPTFTKVFVPDSLLAGNTTTVSYTITNNDGALTLSTLKFTDDLGATMGAGFTFLSGTVSNPTLGGSVTFTSLDTILTLTGGTLGTSTSGTIKVDIQVGGSVASNTYTNLTTDLAGQFSDMSSVSTGIFGTDDLIVTAICVAEGTRVGLASGQRVAIEKMRAGAELVDSEGRAVQLKYNVRLGAPSASFVQIAPGAVAMNAPQRPLFVTPGHPLMLDGRELLPEELVAEGRAAKVHLSKPLSVYTLVTDRRTFVDMEGVLVATWSQDAWENFCQNDEQGRCVRWTKQ